MKTKEIVEKHYLGTPLSKESVCSEIKEKLNNIFNQYKGENITPSLTNQIIRHVQTILIPYIQNKQLEEFEITSEDLKIECVEDDYDYDY